MKIHIDSSKLRSALLRITPAFTPNPQLPKDSHTLITIEEKLRLSVFSPHLEAHVRIDLDPKNISAKPGDQIAVRTDLFANIVKNLPEGEIALKFKSGSGYLEITGKGCAFKVAVAADLGFFPKTDFNSVLYASLDAAKFLRSLDTVSFCANADPVMAYQSIIFMDKDVFAATDGHRVVVTSNGAFSQISEGGGPIMLPILAVERLTKILKIAVSEEDSKQMSIATDGHSLFLHSPISIIRVKLAAIKFPNFRTVIPQKTQSRWSVDREEAIKTLKRALLVMDDKKVGIVHLEFSDRNLVISGTGEIGNTSKGDLEIEGNTTKGSLHINGRFLLDALTHLDGQKAFIEFKSANDPLVITDIGRDTVNVIMPVDRS